MSASLGLDRHRPRDWFMAVWQPLGARGEKCVFSHGLAAGCMRLTAVAVIAKVPAMQA